MNASPVLPPTGGLRRVCRIAWIVCVCLAAVFLGSRLKTLIEDGWTLPVWTWNPAPTPDLQARVVGYERFQYWQVAAEQLLCYGLFAGLFRVFEQGHYFTRRSVRLIQYLALVYFVNGLLRAGGPLLFGFPTDVMRGLQMEVSSLLISGGALIAAWVMQEGRRIQEEQALTV